MIEFALVALIFCTAILIGVVLVLFDRIRRLEGIMDDHWSRRHEP